MRGLASNNLEVNTVAYIIYVYTCIYIYIYIYIFAYVIPAVVEYISEGVFAYMNKKGI